MLPRAVNHIAISVTDINLAMKWYRDVMNFTVLMEPVEFSTESDTYIANLVRNIFGSKTKFLLCHMSSANGVGIELFQFLEPKAELREDNFEYWKSGFYHICVTDPDIEDLVKRIVAFNGKQRSDILELEKGSGRRICFCEDPFGNVIEIYTHSYEQIWSNISSRY